METWLAAEELTYKNPQTILFAVQTSQVKICISQTSSLLNRKLPAAQLKSTVGNKKYDTEK